MQRKKLIRFICKILRLEDPYWIKNITAPYPLYIKNYSKITLKIDNIDYLVTMIESDSWLMGITVAKGVK